MFNVWLAFLNLENMYGTTASLEAALKRCLAAHSPKKVLLEMAKIYDATNKQELAVAMHERVVKEFSSACKAYTEYAMYHYRRKQLSEARALLARGNSRLPERKS